MSFIGISTNIWKDIGGTGGGGSSWVLAPGNVVATLDIDFVNNRAWNNGLTTISSLLSCTRATPALASYVDATGVLLFFGPNVLRYGSNGLLVEESRDNLLTSSNSVDNSAFWNQSGGGVLNANKNATGPDGVANSAWTVSVTGAGTGFYNQRGSVWAANGIVSIWLRAKTGTLNANIIPTGDDNTGSRAIVLTTTWQRFTSLENTNLAGKTRFCFFNFGAGNPTLEVYGAQAENGDFATSYIPTVATSVTRARDVIQSAVFNWYNQSAGTFLNSVVPFVTVGDIWGVSDGTLNEILAVYFNGTAEFFQRDGGVNTGSYGFGAPTANIINKTANAYALNDFAGSLNGGAIGSDTSGTLPTVDRLNLGLNSIVAAPNMLVKRFTYWNTRLANATLQALST